MAIASSCCLNLSPPTPPAAGSNPSLNIPETTQFASWKKNEGRWRNRCVLGMAAGCVIIGLEMSNSSVIIGENKNIAIAEDMLSQVAAVESNGNSTVAKWSDKRKCPPWRVNSLETIVPENLPRPTARRRWESVGFSKTAPPVQMAVTIRTTTSCFSM